MPGISRGSDARAMRRSNSLESMARQLATGNPSRFPGFLMFQSLNIADNSAAMNPLLRDFYDHQVWADAEHARAIGAHPEARDDQAIRNRLHHIAHVQRAFLWTVGDQTRSFAFTRPEDFPS